MALTERTHYSQLRLLIEYPCTTGDFFIYNKPTPVIEEDCGCLIVRLFKDNFVEEQLVKLGLNRRQVKAVLYVKEKGKITNKEYQKINDISKRTASREILELVSFNILEQAGNFGAGSFFQLITPK